MYVSKEYVLSLLPAYRDVWKTVTDNQDVHDIIKDILKAHTDYEKLYDRIGYLFIGSNLFETCDNLYAFCKENIAYQEESEDDQTVSVPQGILTRGYGDCKHYASFIGGCLGAIERYTGKQIDWAYSFASYKILQTTPYHVFVTAYAGDKPIYVDPTPGSDNKQPEWLYEEEIKKTMALKRNVAGFGVGTSGSLVPMQTNAQAANSILQPNIRPMPNTPLNVNLSPATGVAPAPPDTMPPAIVPNITAVPPAGLTTQQWLLIGGGALALYFIFFEKKSLGVTEGEGKKKSLLPVLLLGGGIAAIWWYNNQNAASTAANTTALPANSTAAIQQTIQNQTATGTGPVNMPLIPDANRSAYVLGAKTSVGNYWPGIKQYLGYMSDADILTLNTYFFGFVSTGTPVTPVMSPPYQTLYNDVQAIKTKYNISF